tara:strand:+ start:2474 stop:2866 length:393 start_codon:yes stop_codon:yes gene_type:complete
MPYDLDFEVDDLDFHKEECDLLLAPSSDAQVVQILDDVWEVLSASTLSTTAYKGYIEALIEIPPDLLKEAASIVIKTYVYPSPPKPADFYQAIQNKLDERKIALQRITLMAERKNYIRRWKEKGSQNATH